MQIWIPEQVRLLTLIIACGLLWSLEALIPLYRGRAERLRHAMPNVALTLLLVLLNMLLSSVSAQVAAYTVQNKSGLLAWLDWGVWATLGGSIVGLDLCAYLAHVLLHKSRLGWRFHRVHHSEKEVDVTTAFRQHPGETLWRVLWQLAGIVVFGIPLWMVVIYLMLSSLNAQLEHANIKTNARLDWLLRFVFVTPDMHKAHHSRRQPETDSNYANIFSIWDRLFNTYTARINFRELRYGLDGFDEAAKQSLLGLLKTPFVSCIGLLLSVAITASAQTVDFNRDKAGAPPKGFSTALTGQGKAGVWIVLKDDASPTQGQVLAQTDADATSYRFPLCVHAGIKAKDADISVKFKPVAGKKDQAAGLVWRYRDKDNYYVVRANALENNVVLYKVENGKREDLPLKGAGRTHGKQVKVPAGQWSTLRVTAKANLFTVYLNGEKLYEVENATFTEAGKIGLWTKADSVTYFDDLKVSTQ
jgi:sterol desaturase/sphingolipid hydroxylase (fatty acid hydroxylase superfamily)